MRYLLSLLAVVLSSQSFALTVEFVLLGNSRPFLTREVALHSEQSLGAISVAVLKQARVEFTGSDAGISKIRGRGGELEVLSDTKMRAYGWCYLVDGKLAEVMTDKFVLDPQTHADSTIRWFYAYAGYDRGNWVSQCVPADHLPPQE